MRGRAVIEEGAHGKNSIIITTGTTILSLVLGVPAGYAIARSKSFFINSSSYFFLILLMVPPIAMLIPFYLIMRDLRLLGTYASLIILDTVFDAAFVVWMMRSFFVEIPVEIEPLRPGWRKIAGRRIEARGYGESVPLASNDSPEGRAKNRRIDIVIKPNLDSET